jgi:hypothetical protein
VWQAAVELAGEHGVYTVSHPLGPDYAGLKRRLGGVFRSQRKGTQALIRRTDRATCREAARVRHRVRVIARRRGADPLESWRTAGLDEPTARLAGGGEMIQITAQMRVLVAIEPVDGRKGMDSLARLWQEKLAEDLFPNV